MARQRDPRRDQAKEIWLKSDGEKLLKDIAKEIGVSDSQIRKWKSIDKWSAELKGNVTNDKGNVTNQGGAPLGNQNAKGNKGNSRASPPKGNKNAVTTGEYENLYNQYLNDDEKDLLRTEVDSFFVLQNEINLLRVRQSRMLKRIAEAEKDLNENEQHLLYELRGRKKIVESKGKQVAVNNPELIVTEKRVKKTPKIDLILRIEDALTRVNNSLTKAIKQLSDVDMNKTRKKLMNAQIDYTKAQTTRALINKDGDEDEGGTVINIIDDIPKVN
ncbi:phage terminase small subunit [Enterococcus caccae]|uniref:PBSX phage terminase small subunit-like N-terminal domain-containing protein n=1 Tax=Enterococcus caccae ATCC BAA-1240 TaxID=1158612 RepID=R3WEC0_9ENTE|nr:phage terminase small subunit [Enterococcus caccae]EOL45807.1 hypothetical protein UC7_01604 [Enterococcus caccae ATCC BAA-1240]EOT61003.1 hypothetical protein I580_01905 [Enterococcus caccae ATCC BAA-1240]OJG27966.1 hypothetical protein RU98_GL002175 [Enterococcus caccae]